MGTKKTPAKKSKAKIYFEQIPLDDLKKVVTPKNVVIERKTDPYSVRLDALAL